MRENVTVEYSNARATHIKRPIASDAVAHQRRQRPLISQMQRAPARPTSSYNGLAAH